MGLRSRGPLGFGGLWLIRDRPRGRCSEAKDLANSANCATGVCREKTLGIKARVPPSEKQTANLLVAKCSRMCFCLAVTSAQLKTEALLTKLFLTSKIALAISNI